MRTLPRAAFLRICKISNCERTDIFRQKIQDLDWSRLRIHAAPPSLRHFFKSIFSKVMVHRSNTGGGHHTVCNDQPKNIPTKNLLSKELRRTSSHMTSKRTTYLGTGLIQVKDLRGTFKTSIVHSCCPKRQRQ